MIKAIAALVVIIIIAVVIVVIFVLGGSDDDGGGENAVSVQIQNASDLGALHIELVYDASIFEVTEVSLAGIGENGQVDYEVTNQGRVVIGLIDAMGMNGSGEVVEISFNEKVEGSSTLVLENVTATDANTLYDLVVQTTDGSVNTKTDTSKAPVISLVK